MKTIYDYTKNHLLEWFPKLPSYQAFDRRIGALGPAFQALAGIWLDQVSARTTEEPVYIVDSCPIILAKGPRSGRAKVAAEMCSKSYNSSRKKWYYGAKLHVFVSSNLGHLPTPTALIVSEAAEHNLTAAKQITIIDHPLKAGTLYADKAYADADWHDTLQQEHIQILRTCIHSRKCLMGEEFFRQARQIFPGILVCMARKFNEAWREKARTDGVLRL